MPAFMKEYPTIERNNLGCDHKHLRDRLKLRKLEGLKRMRDEFYAKHIELDRKFNDIANNKRIKNKNASFADWAELEKTWFNLRSLDFFLYRLGYTPKCNATYNVGVEMELHSLYQATASRIMKLGQYRGFQAIYWYWAGGCELWREDGSPEDYKEKDEYWREDLGILLL